MTPTKPRKLSLWYNSEAITKLNPDDLGVIIAIPDEDWEEVSKNFEYLLPIMADALVAAIRGIANPGEDLRPYVDEICKEAKKRLMRANHSLAKIAPESVLQTAKETRH